MHTTNIHYYDFNRIALKILGLWPYQKLYLVRMQNALVIFILITFIIAQLLVLATSQYNFYLLIRVLGYTLPFVFVTLKYCMFVVQTHDVKRLLDEIYDDWNLVQDELEINILKEYASTSRFFTILAMLLCYCCMSVSLIFQFLPMILDIILPLNKPRPLEVIILTEYFVNQDKYFYAIVLHECATSFIGANTLVATGTTLLTYICHTCALFKIARHRIKHAFEENALATCSPRRDCLLYQNIVQAIVIHQRVIEFIDNITSKFAIMFVALILVGISVLSLSLFQFLKLLALMDDIRELLIISGFIFVTLCYMFIANYCGQEITEQGIQLFKATYDVPWYTAPLQTQKLLLFMMINGTKNVTLTCIGVFDASLEGFTSLMSTAVSYFTIIYSIQQ